MQVDDVARKIELPVVEWPGRCYEVASLMCEKGLVCGRPVYGHYHGQIHPDSIFGGRSFTHHGWIARRTTIIDPTRWTFEHEEPYIYVGPKEDPDYDQGGNRVRAMFLRPPPPFNKQQTCYSVPKLLTLFVASMLGGWQESICAEQVCWLASLPLDTMLGSMAKPVYQWVADELKMPGYIPIDNRREILGR